jgi:arylsulfatase A-like enzyme
MDGRLRPLRPTWAWLGVLALWLGWRALALWTRGALSPDVLHGWQLRALVKGALWDVCLGLGLLLAARAVLVVRPDWRRGVLGGLATLAVVSVVFRAGDVVHCYLARSHISAESFLYVEGGFGDRIFEPRGLALLGLLAASLGFAVGLLRRELGAKARWLPAPEVSRRWALLPLGIAAGLLGRPLADAVRYPPHEFELRVIPELNLVRQYWLYRADAAAQVGQQVPAVPPATWQRWQAAGLVPSDTPRQGLYPLFRPGLAEPPLPYARRPGSPERPDVVLTLMESVNRVFVDGLSGKFPGLMPNLSRYASQMTVVDGYWNTTSPTIAGTVASLCSLYSPVHPADLHGKDQRFGTARFVCVAEVLRAAGYRTVFVQGADLRGANTANFLAAHGFDEVLGDEVMTRRFPAAAKTAMGFHDAETMALARETIDRLEAQKAKDGRPFFVVVATLDSHEPGLAKADCALPEIPGAPSDASSRRTLAGYHCSDKALATLGDFLLAPGRREHLLWAVTADHAAFRTLANASVFHDLGSGWSFDRLPLLIHDPTHALPKQVSVLSGSLDVAPTLLHLLGLADQPTTMTGASVFGRRAQLPFLAGRIGGRAAFVKVAATEHEMPMAEVARLCAEQRPLLPAPTPVDACELDLWFRWQDALWSLRRLAPPGVGEVAGR